MTAKELSHNNVQTKLCTIYMNIESTNFVCTPPLPASLGNRKNSFVERIKDLKICWLRTVFKNFFNSKLLLAVVYKLYGFRKVIKNSW